MNSVSAAVLPADRNGGVVTAFGFALLLGYVFLLNSALVDVTIPYFRIPFIVGTMLYVLTVADGGIQRGLSTSSGKLFVALTALMMVSTVFGVWRSNSVAVLTDMWSRSFPIYFVVVAFLTTIKRCISLVWWLSTAFSIMAVIALVRGDSEMGRLFIHNTRYNDPNGLAMACVVALPLLGFAFTSTTSKIRKMISLAGIAPLLLVLVKTGSRGGFLGLCVIVLYLFWKASMPRKLLLVCISGITVMVVTTVVPAELTARYRTLFSGDESVENTDVAAASSAGRLHLLMRSLEMTIENPLLGVGPGNFPAAENGVALEEGQSRGMWHVTHNMYTQVSSEVGIPGFLCFTFIVIHSLRATTRVQQYVRQYSSPSHQSLEAPAFWLRVTLIGFSIAGFFLSVAYEASLPLLAGIATAFMNVVRAEVSDMRVAATPVNAARPAVQFDRHNPRASAAFSPNKSPSRI
jgi:O-antigen ligase